jgi:hypothetical protein
MRTKITEKFKNPVMNGERERISNGRFLVHIPVYGKKNGRKYGPNVLILAPSAAFDSFRTSVLAFCDSAGSPRTLFDSFKAPSGSPGTPRGSRSALFDSFRTLRGSRRTSVRVFTDNGLARSDKTAVRNIRDAGLSR